MQLFGEESIGGMSGGMMVSGRGWCQGGGSGHVEDVVRGRM